MLRIYGVLDDAISLRAFPFFLEGRAKQWIQSLPLASITTWEEMVKSFHAHYFLPWKSTELRNEISSYV